MHKTSEGANSAGRGTSRGLPGCTAGIGCGNRTGAICDGLAQVRMPLYGALHGEQLTASIDVRALSCYALSTTKHSDGPLPTVRHSTSTGLYQLIAMRSRNKKDSVRESVAVSAGFTERSSVPRGTSRQARIRTKRETWLFVIDVMQRPTAKE